MLFFFFIIQKITDLKNYKINFVKRIKAPTYRGFYKRLLKINF